MTYQLHSPWNELLRPPWQGRQPKPRFTGLTMIIDKGMDLVTTEHWLSLAADYVDFIKLGFGTAPLYPVEQLVKKISLAKSYGVDVYPGGTLLEAAICQGKTEQFLKLAKEVGFTYVEVSAGTIDISPSQRRQIITQAHTLGLGVLTEVGKKDTDTPFEPRAAAQQIEDDLATGAYRVIVEARESGRGIGIYDSSGHIRSDILEAILDGVTHPESIMWEAPLVSQQKELLIKLGHSVNLGNIQPGDVLALEATRLGMRSDTLKLNLEEVTVSAEAETAAIS
ncbi:MAG: phosphosulfolactate synthase [Firmicutes bacterium]|jgi:phosphosulfolactate synthase|nr:phosphosulfolactate synthase [Bacillota bacterium]